MNKIITNPRREIPFNYRPNSFDGLTTISGNSFSYGDANGISQESGASFGYLRFRTWITSMVDATHIDRPVTFVHNCTPISWDDAWEIATEEEKLILIQWMQLK
jgi:hypothetical protein